MSNRQTLNNQKVVEVYSGAVAALTINCDAIEIPKLANGYSVVVEATGVSPKFTIKKRIQHKGLLSSAIKIITGNYKEEELIVMQITKAEIIYKLENAHESVVFFDIVPDIGNGGDTQCNVWLIGTPLNSETSEEQILGIISGDISSIKTAVEKVAAEVTVGDGIEVNQSDAAKLNNTEVNSGSIKTAVEKVAAEVTVGDGIEVNQSDAAKLNNTEVNSGAIKTAVEKVAAEVTVGDGIEVNQSDAAKLNNTEVNSGAIKTAVEKVAAEVTVGDGIEVNQSDASKLNNTEVNSGAIKTAVEKLAFDSNGYLKDIKNNPLSPTWISPVHGSAVRSGDATLTLSGFPATIKAANHIITFITVENASHIRTTYENGKNGISIYIDSDNSVTLLGAGATPFVVGDILYNIGIRSIDLAYDSVNNSLFVTEIDPVDEHNRSQIVTEMTNVAAGDAYYPSSSGQYMLPNKNLALQYYLVAGAADTLTMTLQITNDPSLTYWEDISIVAFDSVSNGTGIASWYAANSTIRGFIWLDKLNCLYWRIKITVTNGASNTIKLYTIETTVD